MTLSPSSADDEAVEPAVDEHPALAGQETADAAFGVHRVAELRRRRDRRARHARWAWPALILGSLFLLVAAAVTVSRSQPDDQLARDASDPAFLALAGPGEGGSACVGWPLSVTPSGRPPDRFGAVTLWGDRGAFRLHNGATETLTIDVAAQGGTVTQRDGENNAVGEAADRISVKLKAGTDAAFTLECAATGMEVSGVNASGAPLGPDAFEMGTGPGPSPLQIDKVTPS